MFESSYIDPFTTSDPPAKLVNFASGAVATTEISPACTRSRQQTVKAICSRTSG